MHSSGAPGQALSAPPQGWLPGLPTKDSLHRKSVQWIAFEESQKWGHVSKASAQISVGQHMCLDKSRALLQGAHPNLAAPALGSHQHSSGHTRADEISRRVGPLWQSIPVNLFSHSPQGYCWLTGLWASWKQLPLLPASLPGVPSMRGFCWKPSGPPTTTY